MEGFVQLLPIILILAVFWLFIIRPQVKRQREVRAMQSSLAVGDRVMLTSGIHGTIQDLPGDVEGGAFGDTARVEIAPGVTVTVVRGAIGQVLTPRTGVEEG